MILVCDFANYSLQPWKVAIFQNRVNVCLDSNSAPKFTKEKVNYTWYITSTLHDENKTSALNLSNREQK